MKSLSLPNTTPWSRRVRKYAPYYYFLLLCMLINYLLYIAGFTKSLDLQYLRKELNDSALYDAISRRVHSGESYYNAASAELLGRGYPTGSIFNWRLPYYSFLPIYPYDRLLLALTVFVSSVAAVTVAWDRADRITRFAVCLVQANSVGWLLHREPTLFMEFWAGNFIFISISCYWHGCRRWGILTAVLALFLRELAVLYLLILILFAIVQKRLCECMIIILILLFYFYLYIYHCVHVFEHGGGLSRASHLGWVEFGGMRFLMNMFKTLYIMNMLPVWSFAILVPLSLLGLLGWRDERALLLKMTTLLYVALFTIVGRSSNFYWGWILTPAMQLGLALVPSFLWNSTFADKRDQACVQDGCRSKCT